MQKILFHFEIRYYREHIMSKPNQSKSMKSLRNGRSLRLEGLETRQLLSANMLGAMQSDAVESAIVSSETTTDCTAEAMLAIAQQTAPQSYASAQLADLLPTGEADADAKPNPSLKNVSINYTTAVTNDDLAVTIKNMDKLSVDGTKITIRVVDDANEDILEATLTKGEDGWTNESGESVIYNMNSKTMTVQFKDIEGMKASTRYTITVVAEDAAEVYESRVGKKTFRTAKADSFETVAAEDITVTVNEADPTGSVIVGWSAAEISQTDKGTRYAQDYTVTLYTVSRDRDGNIVEYKKARTVTARDLNVSEDGKCELTVKNLKNGTEYAATIKVTADAGKTVSLESAFSADGEADTTMLKLPNLSLKKAEVTDSSVSFEIRNAAKYLQYAGEEATLDAVQFAVVCTDVKTKEVVEVASELVLDESGKAFLVITGEGLKASTNYRFEIIGMIEGVGATPVSKMTVKTEKVAYLAPAGLEQVAEETTYNTMKVTWETTVQDAKENPVAVARRYTITYTEVLGVNKDGETIYGKTRKATATVKSGVPTGEYTIRGLKANTTYAVTIAAAKDAYCNASEATEAVPMTTAEKMERPSLSYNYSEGTVAINCGVDLSALQDVVIEGRITGSAKYLDENGRKKSVSFNAKGNLTDGIYGTVKISGYQVPFEFSLSATGEITGLEIADSLESLTLNLFVTKITGLNDAGQELSWKGSSNCKINL